MPRKTAAVATSPAAAEPIATPPPTERESEDVIARLARPADTCACGAKSKTGECEHPDLEGEDVIDFMLLNACALCHGQSRGYWRFKQLPGGTEHEAPMADLVGCLARFDGASVRVWTWRAPTVVTIVPFANLAMLRSMAARG